MPNETINEYRSLSLYFLKSLQISLQHPNWIYNYASCHYEVFTSPVAQSFVKHFFKLLTDEKI